MDQQIERLASDFISGDKSTQSLEGEERDSAVRILSERLVECVDDFFSTPNRTRHVLITEIKKVMAELGRRGGSKTSDAKKKAAAESLKKARGARWPKKEKQP